ncbi:MAG: hypothetical protein EA344_09540 [Alkalicoccus sp.]|nr:MAG: hypothetical protein EA344_09540 [Alkalicoccus sp.]
MLTLLSFFCAVGFVIIHLYSEKVSFLHKIPRSKVLSAAGGVSIAYVFMHLLPEMHMFQEILLEEEFALFGFDHYHVYFAGMTGLAVFYGLERMAKLHATGPGSEKHWPFLVHISTFFAYNFLIGYLLLDGHYNTPSDLFLYFAALSVHFISNDHALRLHHEKEYDNFGRYVLAGAIFLGWGTAFFVKISEVWLALLFSILAGTMVLNILKEELPAERESSFWAFAAGVILYTALLFFLL